MTDTLKPDAVLFSRDDIAILSWFASHRPTCATEDDDDADCDCGYDEKVAPILFRAARTPTPEQRDERFGEEIRRQRDAWREYAEHVDHCVECAQMGDIGDCFERKTLQDATKCVRCGGSARLLPAVGCPICVRSITSRSIVSEQEKG